MDTNQKLCFNTILPEIISKYADNPALGFINEEALSYAQMGKKMEAVMAFAENLGIKPGEKVVIYSQNMPNWGVVYFALLSMGIVAVPVLPDFNAHELQNVLNHSESVAIFISKSLEFKLAEVKSDFIKHKIRLDNLEVLQSPDPKVLFDEKATSNTKYDIDENALSILLYTSGTTGDSKGVMLSQRNVIFNAIQSGFVQKIEPKDRFLSILPLSHTYENTIGLILPILHGAGVTYLRNPPTASVLLPAMQTVKPHLMLSVPMIMEKVYRNSVLPQIQSKTATRLMYTFGPTRKLVHKIAGKKLYQTFGGNLKFFGIGGAKLDPQVERFLREAKFPYAIGYGLTETSPLIAGSNPTQTRFQAIGPKVMYGELIINEPDPKTKEGEIWYRGENVMLGYYKNEEKTKEVLTEDGWFKTGDLGVFDKDGWLSHKGRSKNVIIGSNGENIYPEEIESLINNFRHVVESVVLEQKGKLVALVHFNREELEARIKKTSADISEKVDKNLSDLSKRVDETISKLSLELKEFINSKLNKSSKIKEVVTQNEPFLKTATLKIKRHLYQTEKGKAKRK
ncbi:MAG: AMP-binding protein [Bacteroidales bacterium]|nr:AMP-binding protein [Bacteroidales bacterium]MCF8404125.1 AMP-binding protein [Bacteroidales bacterium]